MTLFVSGRCISGGTCQSLTIHSTFWMATCTSYILFPSFICPCILRLATPIFHSILQKVLVIQMVKLLSKVGQRLTLWHPAQRKCSHEGRRIMRVCWVSSCTASGTPHELQLDVAGHPEVCTYDTWHNLTFHNCSEPRNQDGSGDSLCKLNSLPLVKTYSTLCRTFWGPSGKSSVFVYLLDYQ